MAGYPTELERQIQLLCGGKAPAGEVTSQDIKIPKMTERILHMAQEEAQLHGMREPGSLHALKESIRQTLNQPLRSVSNDIDEGKPMNAVRIAVGEDLLGKLALYMYATINFAAQEPPNDCGVC